VVGGSREISIWGHLDSCDLHSDFGAPGWDPTFQVEADSSDFATGAVLSQQSLEDDKWHPVTYYSKSLNAVEWNYKIHDKEMLVVIWALEDWCHFLEGTHHKFEIWTDHKNLEYFMMVKKLNHQQAWWSLYLSKFDFSMHHQPGHSMGKSNALSHRVDHGTGAGDNSNVTLLHLELFTAHAIRALSGLSLEGEEHNILQDICKGNREGKQEDANSGHPRESLSEHWSGWSMMGSSVSRTESMCLMIQSYATASRLSTITPE
jgi:hypothetical protein